MARTLLLRLSGVRSTAAKTVSEALGALRQLLDESRRMRYPRDTVLTLHAAGTGRPQTTLLPRLAGAKRLHYFGEGEADIAGFAPAAGETPAFGFGGIVPAAPGCPAGRPES